MSCVRRDGRGEVVGCVRRDGRGEVVGCVRRDGRGEAVSCLRGHGECGAAGLAVLAAALGSFLTGLLFVAAAVDAGVAAARARAGADAAALAGAATAPALGGDADACAAAARAAAANGARLAVCDGLRQVSLHNGRVWGWRLDVAVEASLPRVGGLLHPPVGARAAAAVETAPAHGGIRPRVSHAHQQHGVRYGVIVQPDALMQLSTVLTPPTSTVARPASLRPMDIDGTTTPVLVEQTVVVDVTRFGDHHGSLSPEDR